MKEGWYKVEIKKMEPSWVNKGEELRYRLLLYRASCRTYIYLTLGQLRKLAGVTAKGEKWWAFYDSTEGKVKRLSTRPD